MIVDSDFRCATILFDFFVDLCMIELTTEELKEHLKDEIFKLISETADELGLECYIVGGYVRDIFAASIQRYRCGCSW